MTNGPTPAMINCGITTKIFKIPIIMLQNKNSIPIKTPFSSSGAKIAVSANGTVMEMDHGMPNAEIKTTAAYLFVTKKVNARQTIKMNCPANQTILGPSNAMALGHSGEVMSDTTEKPAKPALPH